MDSQSGRVLSPRRILYVKRVAHALTHARAHDAPMESEAQATPQLDRRPLYDGILRQGSDNPPPAAEIARQLEPQIAEHLELAAWWPEHELREGWKLGDYSLYAIGFRAAAFKGLYVRFISEPHREALLEVSSSQEDPALKDAAPEHMKEALRGLGFHPGGDGAGFEKPVRVESPDDCRLLAQEMAGLITGCLGYDTTKPITFKRELKEHTQTARVFHFVRHGRHCPAAPFERPRHLADRWQAGHRVSDR